MMRNQMRPAALRRPTCVGVITLAAALFACDSQSVFEGDPLVAPPVTQFDRAATADRAIHGGTLPIVVTATDRFVGVDSVVVRYSGALSGSFTRRFASPREQVRIDTVLAVPFGTQGPVRFEAFALNRYGSLAQADSLTVLVVSEDTIRPIAVKQQLLVPARAELGDTLRVRVQAQDDVHGAGIVRVGAIIRDDAAPAAPAAVFARDLAAPVATAEQDVVIPVAALPGPATARARSLAIIAFAIDQAGNCAAVGATGQPLPCSVTAGQVVVQDIAGATAAVAVTETRTFRSAAPSAAQVGDLVVDAARRSVYISNQANNSVDAISWSGATLTRTGRALVGALPRGMTINNAGTQLIVANSGGTSLSYVNLGTFGEASRYETPNAVLFQIDPAGGAEVLSHRDFRDRPQFVAQDAQGVVFYSTRGPVRRVEQIAGWSSPEAGMMLWTQVVRQNVWGPNVPPARCYNEAGQNVLPCVITYVDSMRIVSYESPFMGTQYDVWAHPPGRPQDVIHVRSGSLYEIERQLLLRGAEPFMFHGEWDYSFWETSETTFVTSSGDRAWLNFADGDAGKAWNWGAHSPRPPLYDRFISDFVNIADHSNNAEQPITAVSANHTGSVFASRNDDAVYLFTNPLRLLGTYAAADIAGGSGVAIHPTARIGTAAGGNLYGDWVAAGSAGPEVVLIETRHFRRIGSVPLVEPLGGPLRVIQRLNDDPADVVAHLFGVTRSGAVFHVPVRHSNFTP